MQSPSCVAHTLWMFVLPLGQDGSSLPFVHATLFQKRVQQPCGIKSLANNSTCRSTPFHANTFCTLQTWHHQGLQLSKPMLCQKLSPD